MGEPGTRGSISTRNDDTFTTYTWVGRGRWKMEGEWDRKGRRFWFKITPLMPLL